MEEGVRHSSGLQGGGAGAHCWQLLLGLVAMLWTGVPCAALAKPTEWQTYLSDSFAESKTAFPSGQFGEAFYTIDNGQYVIDGSKATQDSLSALTDNLYYYYAEAQCRVVSSSAGELAFSGIVFHYSKTLQKQRAYYVFYVYGDGYYGAKRVIGDDVDIVLPLARSTEIDPSGPNTLAVDAQGTRFDLYINGKYVNGFTDVRIDGGGFGFYVSKQTVAAFDNFKVKVERRGSGNDGVEFPASDGGSDKGRDTGKYPRLDVPKDPNRPTYPWEVGVDKSTRARKERRESGTEPVIEEDRLPGRDDQAADSGGEPETGSGSTDATQPGDDGTAEDESYIDPAPRQSAPALPPGEEIVSPADDASDVKLGSPDPAAHGTAVDDSSDPEFSVWETPQPVSSNSPAADAPGLDMSKLGQVASGADARLPDAPQAAPEPDSSQAPTAAHELTKAEKDAQFKAEKERKAREKEERKRAEREAREKREQEERERKAQEAAEREAERKQREEADKQAAAARDSGKDQQDNKDAKPEERSGVRHDDYRTLASAMRRGWDDEDALTQSTQYDLPPDKSAGDKADGRKPGAPSSPGHTPSQPQDEVVGEGVQLPTLDDAKPAADPLPPDHGLTAQPTREVQPGEPSAEEEAANAMTPLYLGERSGDTVLLPPGGDGAAWTEAQPEKADPAALPPALASPQLGELKPSTNGGPAAGPVSTADPFAGKPGAVHISDDFSKPKWPESSAEGSSYRYFGAAYAIDNLQAQNMAISFQEEKLQDLRLDCSCEYVEGSSYVGYGLAARFANGPAGLSYYGFLVSQTGECLLLKGLDGQEQVLADWTACSAFKLNQANRVRIECSGGEVRGYVNGELAVQARDNTLGPGGYALLAGPGVSVRFDDLELYGLRSSK
jgi:hypothetical protein